MCQMLLSMALSGAIVALLFYIVESGGGLARVLLPVLICLMAPAGIVYAALSAIGVVPELHGRESFMDSNPALWWFCVVGNGLLIFACWVLFGLWRPKRAAPGSTAKRG